MALELDVQEQDGRCLILAKGEVDLYSSPAVRDAILKAAKSGVSALGVDLGKVAYMDSSGVATLVEGLKATGGAGKFVLVAPSQSVMKVLQLSRLDSVFEIRDTL
jgi:anti-sigma B factor antagonist